MSKRYFYWGAVVQMIVASGCLGSQTSLPTEKLFSVPNTVMFPVRMSRALFEKPLTAEISLYNSTGLVSAFKAGVLWDIRPEDNQGNHLECIALEEAADFRICFSLMNDVSTFELSAKRTGLEAVHDFICAAAPSECNTSVQSVEWLSAQKSANGFELNYRANPAFEIRISIHN